MSWLQDAARRAEERILATPDRELGPAGRFAKEAILADLIDRLLSDG